MRTKILLLTLLSGIYFLSTAQLAGSNAAMQNSEVEVGVNECGVIIADSVPAGYNNTSSFSDALGIVWTRDGSTFASDYCGDAFVPGSPEEGFVFTSDESGTIGNHQQTCQGFSDFFDPDIPGSITNYFDGPSVKAIRWTGSKLGLEMRQTVVTFDNYPIVVAKVNICNGSGMDLNNAYYGRSWDPDPDQVWAGLFTSRHTIQRQPPVTNDAMVLARGISIEECAIGAVSVDSRARASFGGFFPGSPADMWNGAGFYSLSGNNIADEANQLSWNLGTIADGTCDCLAWAWFFDEDDKAGARTGSLVACESIPEAITSEADLRELISAVSTSALNGEIAAYPNPASGFFQLDMRDFAGAEIIRVFDVSGSLVYSIQAVDAVQTISTDGWTPGLYIVTVGGGQNVRTTKVSVH